jgi:sigma-54 specific flagellar transcriptional regulator A
MRQVLDLVRRVAPMDTSVSIFGPSGSGKEFVARALHTLSGRNHGPFIPVNCGAIPRDLLESELFGSERGAYTGSVKMRQGYMEAANGGTLFLDEIGEMPLEMQVKLLRVLEERSFTRIGSNDPIKTDVRFICATHRNMEQLVASGQFREDLYYRLNVFPITVASLEERVEDIPKLIDLTLERFQEQGFPHLPQLTDCAIVCLQGMRFPGNIRQLRNILERLAILYPSRMIDEGMVRSIFRPIGKVSPVHETESLRQSVNALAQINLEAHHRNQAPYRLPANKNTIPSAMESALASISESIGETAIRYAETPRGIDPKAVISKADAFDLREYLQEVEGVFIRHALEDAQGSVSKAARTLGLHRTTLIEKMKKLSLEEQ